MPQPQTLNRTIVLTGLTSFFTDIGAEMAYPLVQAFVKALLSTRRALVGPALGVIEGAAESCASLLKVASGYWSDRTGGRKRIVIGGYSLSAASKSLFFLAPLGWYFVLIGRILDRVGKGVRTAPRDALIAESTPRPAQGRAFGVQRAMDFAGAVIGTLLCYAFAVHFLDPDSGTLVSLKAFYVIFGFSIVPAFIAVVFLFFVSDTSPHDITQAGTTARLSPTVNLRDYDPSLRMFFAATALFTLGNSSNQFLFLRTMDLGVRLPTLILMYLVFNLVVSLLAPFFGGLSDRVGCRTVLVWGYVLYAAVYASFGFIGPARHAWLWIIWPLYGLYYAMTEGVEKALVSLLAPKSSRATAIGIFHTIVGVGLLPASLLAGALYSLRPSYPFLFGSAMSVMSVGVLVFFVPDSPPASAGGRP